MRRTADASTEREPPVGPDQVALSRRNALKFGLAIIGVCALGKPSPAMDPDAEAYLQKHGAELPGLAADLAEMELQAIADGSPTVLDCLRDLTVVSLVDMDCLRDLTVVQWCSLRYVTVVQWCHGIILCAVISPVGEKAPLSAAKTLVARTGCRVLADGWSNDRRVGAFFATGYKTQVGSAAEIAQDIDVWRQSIIFQEPDGLTLDTSLVRESPSQVHLASPGSDAA